MIILPFLHKSAFLSMNSITSLSRTTLVETFENLSREIDQRKADWPEWARQAKVYNPWFTEENVLCALSALTKSLTKEKLLKLLEGIPFQEKLKKVGVVMAGNLPLVGFHDFMCILLSGNLV